MGIRWHSIAAKFKQRLNLSDLHAETDYIYESAAKHIPDLIQALRNSEPEVDHSRVWRISFSQKLDAIAAELTRQTQAAECRRLLIKVSEDHALADALIGKNALVASMFLEGEVTTGMSDEEIQRLVARKFIYLVVDKTALTMLYRVQFNSSLPLDRFSDELTEMCKISAHFVCNEAACMLLSVTKTEREESVDKYYLEVTHPGSIEFEKLKQRYVENLCLLSPCKPDAKPLDAFKKRTLSATKPYL